MISRQQIDQIYQNNKPLLNLLIFSLIIAIFLSRKCAIDETCESDPLYGGCSDICTYDNIDLFSVLVRTFGILVLSTIASFIGRDLYKEPLSQTK